MNFIFALILFSKFDCACGSSCFNNCIQDKKEICELRAFKERVFCVVNTVKEQEAPETMSSDEFKKQLNIKVDKCIVEYKTKINQCKIEFDETVESCENIKQSNKK